MAPRPPSSYQVKEEDKDFLTLSANLGMNYDQLRQANPFVQSLSTGQHINLPGLMFGVTNPGGALGTLGSTALVRGTTNAIMNRFLGDKGGREGNLGIGGGYGSYNPTPYRPTTMSGVSTQTSFGNAKDLYNIYGPGRASALGQERLGVTSSRFEVGDAWISGANRDVYEDVANQYALTGAINPNTPKEIIDALVLNGADPNKIKQAMQKGQQQFAASNDPLAGQPGHYYADEKTAPLIGQVITLANGTRRRLLADKDGRLYYGKIGASRRGKEARRRRAAAAAAAAQGGPVEGSMTTALNVILGS